MHPYDRWGFSDMGKEADDLYWRYCIARFSAYRNLWWSLANEYDLMKAKTLEDWEHYASLLPAGPLQPPAIRAQLHVLLRLHPALGDPLLHAAPGLVPPCGVHHRLPHPLRQAWCGTNAYEGKHRHGLGKHLRPGGSPAGSGRPPRRRGPRGDLYRTRKTISCGGATRASRREVPARIKFLHEIDSQTPGLGRGQQHFWTRWWRSPRFSHPPSRGVRNPLLRLWPAQLPQLPARKRAFPGGWRSPTPGK